MRVHKLFGQIWIQFLKYPPELNHPPLTEKGHTQETEFPWRMGVCRVFRVPLTNRAVALGKWVDAQPSEVIDDEPTLTFRQLPTWFQDV